MLDVIKPVPFGEHINVLKVSKEIPPKLLEAWFGWQFNRNTFATKTGFEPFFLENPRERHDKLLGIGQSVYDGIKRANPHTPIDTRIYRVLTEEYWDLWMIYELGAWLGAELGIHRAKIFTHPKEEKYHQMVKQLSTGQVIRYSTEKGEKPSEQYALPIKPTEQSVSDETENKDGIKLLYWTIVSNLGKMGEPVLRTHLKQ